MTIILPQAKNFSSLLGEALGTGFGTAGGAYLGQKLTASKNQPMYEEFKKEFGVDISKYPKDVQAEFAKQFAKSHSQQKILENIKNQRELKKSSQESVDTDVNNMDEDSFQFAEDLSVAGLKGLSEIEAKKAEIEVKKQNKREERGEVRADKYLEEARKSKTELYGQQASLRSAEQAVLQGKEGLSGDFWANYFGLPELKSVSGAALDAAAKIHLMTAISNLSGGRPNQFLEKQISQAFAMPGASKEANLAKIEILKYIADIKQLEVDKAFEIANRFEEKGKPIPGKIDRLALKEIEPQADKRAKKLTYKLQEFLEPKETDFNLTKIDRVAENTPLTNKKAKILFYKANPNGNFKEPTEEEIQKAEKLATGLGYNINAYQEAFGD